MRRPRRYCLPRTVTQVWVVRCALKLSRDDRSSLSLGADIASKPRNSPQGSPAVMWSYSQTAPCSRRRAAFYYGLPALGAESVDRGHRRTTTHPSPFSPQLTRSRRSRPQLRHVAHSLNPGASTVLARRSRGLRGRFRLVCNRPDVHEHLHPIHHHVRHEKSSCSRSLNNIRAVLSPEFCADLVVCRPVRAIA